MPIRIVLIAHGATEARRTARFPDGDEELTADAEAAAEDFAKRLGRFDRVYAGPAHAAGQTASLFGHEAVITAALGDADHGSWTGRTLAEIAVADPAAFGSWIADPSAAPHGGEALTAFVARIGGWLDGLVAERGTVLAVAPPGVLRAAIVHVLGAPPAAFWKIDIEPLGRVDLSGDGRRLVLKAIARPEPRRGAR